MSQNNNYKIPKHIAIIMDGNRRWARKRGLAALYGHDYVSDHVIEPLVDRCIEMGVKYLTLWAFSTENWQRDQREVEGLMQIFRKSFKKNAERLYLKGVRLQTIGEISRFPEDIQQSLHDWRKKTQVNDKITVTFALNYGGRDEIVRGIQKSRVLNGSLSSDNFGEFLDTAGMPDPDLIIRPGGEFRLSGFLPWQSTYSELFFTEILMPDFSPAELDKAVGEYERRQRRFGA